MTERAETPDPFPITADPRNYVQTAATEDALAALQRKVREGRVPVALVGVPGIGKTLLLRVLERRLVPSYRVVYLPFALLPADELYAWVLGLLGEGAGPDPERALLAAGLRLEGSGSALVVMLDDAGSMPVATARRLSTLLAEAEGAIRMVLALADGNHSEQMLSAFQPGVNRVELRALASSEETARYVRAHLVRSNASPEVRARFDPASIRDLHRGSGGVPRIVSSLAGEVARGNLAVLPRLERGGRGEDLGADAEPFTVTSDPGAYVPRRATQELLASVETALRKGRQVIAVTGPAGLGKTLLLRVLERRLRGRYRPVRISYTALLPDEFCRWVLTLVGEPAAEDPEAALLELARRFDASRTSLVLLLDDAGAIPLPTVRYLAELARETKGATRLVLFAVEDVRTPGILGALGSDALTLRFCEPMSEDETAEYIYARLAHARAPSGLVEQFDPETVAQLHVDSEGIPRELHNLASELYRGGNAAVAAPSPAPAVHQAPTRPEAEAPPPAPPSRVEAAEPKRAPAPARPPISGRAVAYGLGVLAILLAAIPLFRGGFPWMPALQRAAPAVTEPAELQPQVTPAVPAAEPTVEPIAVDIDAVPWASIEVDGKYLGVTPLADVSLSPGLHIVRAQMPGGEIREHRVEVGATMRHLVFYAESEPEPVEPEPKTPTEPAPPPPSIPEELPQIAVEAGPYLERELPEIAVGPERGAALREPEPAPPPVAPEPELAPSRPPAEETPEIPAAPEPVASLREPVPAAPPPAAPLISVSINATPWASIEIDGDEVGITPLAGILLAPGNHDFHVTMPDGTTLDRTVWISSDNRHIAFSK